MKIANFIDLNILLKTDSMPWIVSKDNANLPILKLKTHEFNLFKSGIYQNQGNKIEFNGKTFWISDHFMEKIKISCKRNKIDVTNLAISMQEFLNKSVIDHIDFRIDMSIFNPIINTNNDIYIICSKNNKRNYEKQIEVLEKKMSDIGLKVKNYYFVSETFYNRDEDKISYTKVKILIQHLIGLKANIDKITSEEITKYDHIFFYDDNKTSIEMAKNINSVLEKLLIKTDSVDKLIIKDKIKNFDNVLIVKEYTNNKANLFIETIVPIEYSEIIRSFENFKN